jgi:cobalt/nickel transport system ATP-binding protein
MVDSNMILRLSGVSCRYHPERPVLSRIDLEVPAGERLGLLGANGSGKTTLLQLIVGLVRPSSGDVEVFGKVRRREADFAEVRQRVGLVFQDPDDQLFCPTVAEDVAFGPLNLRLGHQRVREIVADTLGRLGLAGFEDRVTYQLSMGERRLVCLATVLAMDPELLLLDEPTANLDSRSCRRLIDFLDGWPHGLILVSHHLPVIRRLCRRVIILGNGQIAADGPTEQILADERLLQAHGLNP